MYSNYNTSKMQKIYIIAHFVALARWTLHMLLPPGAQAQCEIHSKTQYDTVQYTKCFRIHYNTLKYIGKIHGKKRSGTPTRARERALASGSAVSKDVIR